MASGDCKTRSTPKNPSQLIRKLVVLMEHPISQHATERHLPLLKEFLCSTDYAFWLQDIPYIIRLYEAILKRLYTIVDFREPLENLLQFSAVPPMMIKVSDKIEYARDLEQYFSTLGYLILCIREDDLKELVITAIKGLLEHKPPVGYRCVPLENCNTSAERSRLPEILTELVELVSDDLYPSFLDLMFLVSRISRITCRKILSHNGLEYLLRRLEPTWRKRDLQTKPKKPTLEDNVPAFEDTCCVLWNLLNAVDESTNVSEPSEFALWSLQYAFRWSNMHRGQKFNRNNMAALILKILITFPTKDFSTHEIFDDILVLSTALAGCGCLSDLVFTEDDMDFQLKKIIMACLHFFQPTKPFVFTRSNDIVKSFVKRIFEGHTTNKNETESYCRLAKVALKMIPNFIRAIEAFLTINGPVRVLGMIEGYLLKTYDIELLEAYLYCLSEVLMQRDENIVRAVARHESANMVLDVCIKIVETTPTLSTMYQKALARGFCIMQFFCAEGYFKNLKAITFCIDYLKRVVQPSDTDRVIDVRVTICAIHLLWECITSSRHLFKEFLKLGGVYVLLDITEACTFPVKSLALGVLADASKKSSSMPYFITWRKHGKRLLSLLMEIFRNKTEKECDNANKAELQGEHFKNVWLSLCQKQRVYFRAGCVKKSELLKICRCRIHGILYSVKVRFRDKVEFANEHYKLFNEKLNIDDEITTLFAENYLSLTMCKSWLDLAKELKKEGIIPVHEDNKKLVERIHMIKQWKSFLQDLIEAICKKGRQNEKLDELEIYTLLREARLSDALDALQELRYISNCTERMFQMKQKLVLQTDIETDRTPSPNFHRTICELPFTNIYDQSISIQSNVIYEKKEVQTPPTPVSLDDNNSLSSRNSEHDLNEHLMTCDMD